MGGECHPRSEACLYSCGLNSRGQCGLSNSLNTIEQFKLVSDIKNPKKIACGGNHSLVIDGDGTLYACGDGSQGQLGLGSTENKNKFTKVSNNVSGSFTNKNITQIACGQSFSFCVDSSNNIYSCGDNSRGQLGLGSTIDKTKFTKVTNIVTDINDFYITTNTTKIDNIVKISCGSFHTLLILTGSTNNIGNNSVYSCGNNDDGQLGLVIPEENNTNSDYNTFAKVPNSEYFTNEYIKDISCGALHSLFCNSNELYGAGSHNKGQLGLGEGSVGSYFEFQKITINTSPQSFIQLSSMSYHNMILVGDKKIYGCGKSLTNLDEKANKLNLENASGEDITTFKQNTYANINTGSKISTGIEHSLVIAEDGILYSTGSNIHNQLGFSGGDANSKLTFSEVPYSDNFTNEDVSHISCGGYHSLIIVS